MLDLHPSCSFRFGPTHEGHQRQQRCAARHGSWAESIGDAFGAWRRASRALVMETTLLGSGCSGGACSESTSPAKVRRPLMFSWRASCVKAYGRGTGDRNSMKYYDNIRYDKR